MTTCKVCAKDFQPFQPLQQVCGLVCARRVPIIARNTLKAEKKADRAKKAALKPRSKWMKEAQEAFNAWIRKRDEAEPCISCGRHHNGQWHAGHYLSTGARPELRFDPANVHKQCQPCNTHLHGNLALYRSALVRKIGPVGVDWLEGPHAVKKYTIDDLKSIISLYKEILKELNALSM